MESENLIWSAKILPQYSLPTTRLIGQILIWSCLLFYYSSLVRVCGRYQNHRFANSKSRVTSTRVCGRTFTAHEWTRGELSRHYSDERSLGVMVLSWGLLDSASMHLHLSSNGYVVKSHHLRATQSNTVLCKGTTFTGGPREFPPRLQVFTGIQVILWQHDVRQQFGTGSSGLFCVQWIRKTEINSWQKACSECKRIQIAKRLTPKV
mgnify:CR=1 FL=1